MTNVTLIVEFVLNSVKHVQDHLTINKNRDL